MKTRMLPISTLIIAGVFSVVVHADRDRFTLLELAQESDLVLVGKVQSVQAQSKGDNKRIARIVPHGAALKGKVDRKAIKVSFQWVPVRESVAPVQLQTGKEYCLFLVEKSKKGYVLVNKYDGAHLLEDAEEENFLKSVRQAVEKEKRWKRLHENLKLELAVEDRIVLVGESPLLRFEVTNTGNTAIPIPGNVLNSSGELVLKGYTSLLFASFEDGSFEAEGSLGRSPQRGSQFGEREIDPGQKMVWRAPFDWADFGKKPGQYRLVWQFGKQTSSPVIYQVREIGVDLGIESETSDLRIVITNKSDQPVSTFNLGTMGNTLYLRKPSGRILKSVTKEQSVKEASNGGFDIVVPPDEIKVIQNVKKTFTSSFSEELQKPGKYEIWCDIVAWGNGEKRDVYTSNTMTLFIKK